MEFIPNTSIKYYVNGVLVATHTTNLPVMDPYIHFHIRTLQAVAKEIHIGPVSINKYY